MATRWRMTRLSAETRSRLDSARERFLAGCETGKRVAEIDCRNEQVSVDWVVRQLLDLLDKQEAREAKARAKRRKTANSADLATQ